MGGIKQKYNLNNVFEKLNKKQHGTGDDSFSGTIKNRNKRVDKSATHNANKRSGRGS